MRKGRRRGGKGFGERGGPGTATNQADLSESTLLSYIHFPMEGSRFTDTDGSLIEIELTFEEQGFGLLGPLIHGFFPHKYVPQYGQFSGCLKPLMQTGDMEEASVEMTVSSDF